MEADPDLERSMTVHQDIGKMPTSCHKLGKMETRCDFAKCKSPDALDC